MQVPFYDYVNATFTSFDNKREEEREEIRGSDLVGVRYINEICSIRRRCISASTLHPAEN